MTKNTICLWYDKDAETAARFYAETFPDSTMGAILRAPGDYPSGKKGDAGWKGRGLWAANGDRTPWLIEGGKGTKPLAAHFQLRPDPLAK